MSQSNNNSQPPAAATYSREQLEAVGGRYWESDDGSLHRLYFNDLPDLLGLSVSRYGTGNISGARLNGQNISNSAARRIINRLEGGRFWWDCDRNGFYFRGLDSDDAAAIKRGLVEQLAAAQDQEATNAPTTEPPNTLLALIGGWDPDTDSVSDLHTGLRAVDERDRERGDGQQSYPDNDLVSLPVPSNLPAGLQETLHSLSGWPLWTVDGRGWALIGETADQVRALLDVIGDALDQDEPSTHLAGTVLDWEDEDLEWLRRAAHEEYTLDDVLSLAREAWPGESD